MLVCGLVTLAAALSLVIGTWWIAKGLPLGLEGRRLVAAVRVLLRRVGLPLLGLAFFLFWTFFYVGLWWYRPEATFAGLSAHPYFADFFYYAVSTSFIAPPGDIIASSRGARTATMIEMLTGSLPQRPTSRASPRSSGAPTRALRLSSGRGRDGFGVAARVLSLALTVGLGRRSRCVWPSS